MDIISREEAIKQGLIYYFTGKPCKRGHIAKRYVKNSGKCVECNNIDSRQWREDHKERGNELQRIYAKNNPDKVRTRIMSYRKSHLEEYRAYQKEYHKNYRMGITVKGISKCKNKT